MFLGFPLSLDRETETARSFGVTATLAPVHDRAAVEEAVAALSRQPGGGLITLPDSFNVTHRDVIIAAAARQSEENGPTRARSFDARDDQSKRQT
jgi:hypothetical protein